MEPWLALIGPGAGRRKGAVKRDEDAGGGRGWRERAGASGEVALVKSGEEERELGESDRAEVSGQEEEGAAKVVGRKEGDREGFARSFWGGEERPGGGGGGVEQGGRDGEQVKGKI